MIVKKAYYCVYEVHSHMVFTAKYRKALLDDRITKEMKEVSKKIEERDEIEMEEIGWDQNHLHLDFSI